MTSMTPKRWLTIAGVCAVLWFLSGAPEITDSDSTFAAAIIWAGFVIGLVGVVALIMAGWGLYSGRTKRT